MTSRRFLTTVSLVGLFAGLTAIGADAQTASLSGKVSSAEEGLMIVREARRQGVEHVVVTHAMKGPIRMTIPQMQAAARDGAFIEFVYGATLGTNPVVSIKEYADAIRAVGPKSCILATDFGAVQKPPEPKRPLEPQGLLDFMNAIHKEGISVADVNLMTKTNPALALGLHP